MEELILMSFITFCLEIQRVLVSYMTLFLSVEKMMEAKDIFDLCDTNSDGRIDGDELRAYFQKIGISLSQKEIDNMISVADGNHSGFVEFEEFVRLLQ